MDTDDEKRAREARWLERLEQTRMLGLAEVGLAFLQPISPLVAQLLYVAQPVVGKFDRQRDLQYFAELLEDPTAFEQFADRLLNDRLLKDRNTKI
jgi:hypothetical protein